MFLKSSLLNQFDDLVFGFSTKLFNHKHSPFFSNMSLEIGDDKTIVEKNRKVFTDYLGISLEQVAYQHQIHSDIVSYVTQPGFIGESDAMITDKTNLALTVGSADCTTVFIYDYKQKIIAAIHSGWQGTQKRIVEKTILKLQREFHSNQQDCVAYIAPSISMKNYEVGKDFLTKFDEKYFLCSNGKYYLNVAAANYDMLINNGIDKSRIQFSNLCSFENTDLFHSYRRDKENSGRAWGLIMMKDYE
ncbi:MAG: peptidoglycan editing factor PgeF [Ignavibacteriales bacterium]